MEQRTTMQTYMNWLLLALFFGYQYVLRGIPSVFSNEIRQTFGMGANQFSDLGAWCMFAYCCCQIPAGIIVDRIGIRRCILIAFALCLVGQWMFTHAQACAWALLGRILVGMGGAPAYLSAIKCIVDTFPVKSWGLFIGITGIFTLSTVIFNPLLKHISVAMGHWQDAAGGVLMTCGVILFVICWLFLRVKPSQQCHGQPHFWAMLKSVACNYKVYICSTFIIGTNVVAVVLIDLWGPAFLVAKYQLQEQQAVLYTQLSTLGIGLGELLLPLLFRRSLLLGTRLCCLGMAIVFGIFLYSSQGLPLVMLQMLLLWIGIFSAADVFAFTMGAHLSTAQNAGLVSAWINFVGMMGEPVLQKWVGMRLDHHWAGHVDATGLRMYQAADYVFALRILWIVAWIGFLIAMLVGHRKKHAPEQSATMGALGT